RQPGRDDDQADRRNDHPDDRLLEQNRLSAAADRRSQAAAARHHAGPDASRLGAEGAARRGIGQHDRILQDQGGIASRTSMASQRRIIAHLATSADGYIARPDGNLDWLTTRPAPKGFYGMPAFARTVDAKILGRKTFELSVEMGARFTARDRH